MHILDLTFLGFSTEVLPKSPLQSPQTKSTTQQSMTEMPSETSEVLLKHTEILDKIFCYHSLFDTSANIPIPNEQTYFNGEAFYTINEILVRNLQCCNNESISVGTTGCFLECFSSLKSTPTKWTVWYHCRTSHFKLCSSNLAMVGSFMTFGCQTGPANFWSYLDVYFWYILVDPFWVVSMDLEPISSNPSYQFEHQPFDTIYFLSNKRVNF